jgi:hypothetical protein
MSLKFRAIRTMKGAKLWLAVGGGLVGMIPYSVVIWNFDGLLRDIRGVHALETTTIISLHLFWTVTAGAINFFAALGLQTLVLRGYINFVVDKKHSA